MANPVSSYRACFSLTERVVVAIVGAGPAGLMVADRLSAQGVSVHLYDRMPTLGRKFLQAGKGGLNLTHSEPFSAFLNRFSAFSLPADHSEIFSPYLQGFSAQSMRDWASELGIDTFIGSSGRVFPSDMKAAPLLRAWLHRLKSQGVVVHTKHRWVGWQDEALVFEHQGQVKSVLAGQVVFALGGASWSHLGSDGQWVDLFRQQGIAVTPLLPANGGFQVDWDAWFVESYAGSPVKQVAMTIQDQRRIGEWVITQQGIEGSLVYALSAEIRNALLRHQEAVVSLDLVPYQSLEKTLAQLKTPKGKRSWSEYLRKTLGIDGVRFALLKLLTTQDVWQSSALLATAIHHLPLKITAMGALEEAISTAGGVDWSAVNSQTLTLNALPNHYCVGEMLDWEAPTGGYLLTMTMATAVVAAEHILKTRGVHG